MKDTRVGEAKLYETTESLLAVLVRRLPTLILAPRFNFRLSDLKI
jgi:hypothetical protein